MENIGAVHELSKVTNNLECRINEIELIRQKLKILNRTSSGDVDRGATEEEDKVISVSIDSLASKLHSVRFS